MTAPDLVVRGGTVVRPEGVAPLDVVVRRGRIEALAAPGAAPADGTVVVDAGGLLVLAGAVDAHVHFEEPGRVEWEGFDHGSAAAAAGGITTVVDMPIDSDPPTTTAARVAAKAEAARRSSRVDVALWGGLVPEAVPHLEAMVAAGVVGFKAFACPSGWDDFPAVDEPTLRTGLAVAARHGRPVAVHAELEELGHTADSEVAAVRWAAGLAAEAGAPLHVVHVSAAEAVAEAGRWPDVSVETCPHYLVLTDEDAARIGGEAHCNPPIRSAANQAALWEALADGRIAWVASDHSPCPTAAKAGPDPWAGITGVDTFLPALLSSARSTGRLDLPAVARVITAAAARLDLAGKGRLEPGFDADLVLVDPDEVWAVDPATLFNRHGRSPLAGQELQGRVRRTYVRGRLVFDATTGPGEAGGGAVLTPGHRVPPPG